MCTWQKCLRPGSWYGLLAYDGVGFMCTNIVKIIWPFWPFFFGNLPSPFHPRWTQRSHGSKRPRRAFGSMKPNNRKILSEDHAVVVYVFTMTFCIRKLYLCFYEPYFTFEVFFACLLVNLCGLSCNCFSSKFQICF